MKLNLYLTPCVWSVASVASDSVQLYGLWPARLLCPWDSPKQEYWSELPCPPPGDLPNPGIEPAVSPVSSALWEVSFLLSHLGSPSHTINKN